MIKNNFDILRISLAIIVFYMHMGSLADISILTMLPGKFAVHCFFVVSGYLIVKSYLRSRDVRTYFMSRFLRIYPLYFIVVSLCFVLGYLNYSQDFSSYMTFGAFNYLTANYFFANFLAPTLPELFLSNKSSVINGALWTIKVEVMFYLSVPIIYGFLTRYLEAKKLTLIFAMLSVLFYYIMGYFIDNYSVHHSLNNQLPSLMVFFMVGAYFNFADLSFLKVWHLLVLLPLLVIFYSVYPIYAILVGLFVYIVVNVISPVKVSDKIGDVSYGIYIWHYPVIQFFVMHNFYENTYIGVLLSSLAVTLMALGSWHFIESKLVRKSR